MNNITKKLVCIFGMMLLLNATITNAQWTHVIAPVNESDISKVTEQSYQNYKGLTAATFEIIGSVEAVKEKGKVKFKLHTQSINMVKYNTYSYRPAPKLKSCIYNKLLENETNNYFSANQIGEASFEQAMRSASATFDVEITFIVKDDKYGIAGFGSEKGWGYRATRIFKNVKANGVFWADETIETTFPIEEIKILNNPKLVSFRINDSGIQTAILDFVKKRNQEVEDECKGKTKENEADNKKKDEEGEKAEASVKEIEAMKNKLQNQSSVTIKSSTKTNDFWSGGMDKSTASTGKDTEDFWNGGEEKGANNNNDFWSGGRDQTTTNNGNSGIEAVNKDGRIYLKDAYDIIKEWDSNKYYSISKLNSGNEFFTLSMKPQGTDFSSRNKIVIVDKKGNTVKIDGEEIFSSIGPREGGGYVVIKYLSGILYKEKTEGKWNPKDSYISSTEAINDVKTNVARENEAIRIKRQNDSDNTVYFIINYVYNVVNVKEIITNAKMQALITKSHYKVLSNY